MAQNQDQILNTILSRTQLVKVPALTDEEIKQYLIAQHPQTEHTAAEIAFLSNGNLTEALAMLNDADNSYHDMFVDWLRMCYTNKKGGDMIDFVEQLSKMGRENQKNFLRYGISYVRECCMIATHRS